MPVNEELDLPILEPLEKLCFMELEVDLNILGSSSSSRPLIDECSLANTGSQFFVNGCEFRRALVKTVDRCSCDRV